MSSLAAHLHAYTWRSCFFLFHPLSPSLALGVSGCVRVVVSPFAVNVTFPLNLDGETECG